MIHPSTFGFHLAGGCTLPSFSPFETLPVDAWIWPVLIQGRLPTPFSSLAILPFFPSDPFSPD